MIEGTSFSPECQDIYKDVKTQNVEKSVNLVTSGCELRDAYFLFAPYVGSPVSVFPKDSFREGE